MKKFILTIITISLYIFINSTYSLGSYISCGGISIPKELAFASRMIVILLKYVAPFVLIIMGSIDFIKAITGGNDNDIKDKQKLFIKRIAYGGLLFFVISFAELVVNITADNSDGKNFSKCLKCLSKYDSDCDGDVDAPFDINNPEQDEIYNPDEGFNQPERQDPESSDSNDKKDSEDK